MRSIVRVSILSSECEDRGVGTVLSVQPFCLLVPLHLVSAIEDGDATAVLVEGIEYRKPMLALAPELERDQLAVIRFSEAAPKSLRPIRLPRRTSPLCGEQTVTLLGPGDLTEESRIGRILEVRTHGGASTLLTDIAVDPGDSGSCVFSDGRLIGLCQGRVEGSARAAAIVIAFSPEGLRRMARLRSRQTRRTSLLRAGSAGALLLIAIGGAFLGFERLPFLSPEPEPKTPTHALDAYEIVPELEVADTVTWQAIDGFSVGSIPINWWFSLYGSDKETVFSSVPVGYVDGQTCIRYPYPERGDWNACALQLPDFGRPIDTSLYDAIEFVARADEVTPLRLEISFTDRAISPHPDDPPDLWGCNTAALYHVIWLSEEFRTFRIPFEDFHVQSWNLERYPDASRGVSPATFNEIRFRLQDDAGMLEILRVDLVRLPRTPIPVRSETLTEASFVASLNNDERALAGLDYAFMQEGENPFGAFWEMVWESPSPVDLTCLVRRGIPVDATAFSLVLSANEPMEVEAWACGEADTDHGWKGMASSHRLTVDATPRRYLLPFATFTESGFQGDVPLSAEEWPGVYSLILWPTSEQGSLQVYEVSYAAPSAD